MRAVNVVEALVWKKLEEILADMPDICKCDKCISDMAAYALNRVNPRYVASEEGELYVRAEHLDKEFNTALLVILTEAIQVVSKNPRHDNDKE